jgi:hypothetical protein
MRILDLFVTQNCIRSIKAIDDFQKIIRISGFDTFEPIQLLKLKNTRTLYIWNGHHRLAAAYTEGIREIDDKHFSIMEMSRAQLQSINLDAGYVTPFDIINECRSCDFLKYKTNVLESFKRNPKAYSDILLLILASHMLYREPRRANFITDIITWNIP